jgi:Uma2 family endonuclease
MQRSPAALKPATSMTLEEWADLDDEIEGELIDGVLEEEEMATHLHELVVTWVTVVLHHWARRHGARVTGSDTKIAVGPRRGRKPDVSVYVRGRQPALQDSLVTVAPHIVVEVVSPRPRDARRDRIDKQGDYARAGVRFYWILDPQLRSFEVLELSGSGRFAVVSAASAGKVRVPGCPGLVIDLDALWQEIDEAEAAESRSRRKRL